MAFSPYTVALICVLAQAMVITVLSFKVGLAKGGDKLEPGMIPEGGLSNPTYRIHRLHINSIENFPSFAAVVLIACMAGVWPWLANLCGLVYFLTRLMFAYLYLDEEGGGATRSMVYAIGWGAILLLGMAALLSLTF